MSDLGIPGLSTWTSPAFLSLLRMLTGLLVIGGAGAAWDALVAHRPILPPGTPGGLLAVGALFSVVTGLFAN